MLLMFIMNSIIGKIYWDICTKKKEKGQGLIEYALIILLIVVGVIVILGLVGGEVQTLYQKIINGLP